MDTILEQISQIPIKVSEGCTIFLNRSALFSLNVNQGIVLLYAR